MARSLTVCAQRGAMSASLRMPDLLRIREPTRALRAATSTNMRFWELHQAVGMTKTSANRPNAVRLLWRVSHE